MSEKQLNDLPEEILLLVFDKMDFKTLLESSLVCRKWNEMIEDNSAIIKKIKLVVDLFLEKFRKLPEKLTRQYRSIKISGNFKDEFNWKLLERQASNLRSIEIYRYKFKEEEKANFKKFLSSMTKLETLRISFCSDCDIDLIHHNQLKLLALDRCRIVNFPGTAQLTYLYLKGCSSELISFLYRQKNLEELTILDNELNSNINLEILQAIQFPLKKLAIYGPEWLGSEENLLLFINRFVNSLEEVYFGHKFEFPESFYKLIFKKLRKLNTLRAISDYAPKGESFYYDLNTNLSVQKLIIYGVSYWSAELEPIKGIIGKLPNLRTLVLDILYFPKELMMFIASNLKMLKEFKVSKIFDEVFEGLDIPSLKKITIENFKHNNLQQMVRAMPNIEEFKVDWFGGHVESIAEGWPKLKHVKLGYGFKARKEIFEQFLRNCKDLKSIEIYKDAFKTDSEKEEILREVKRDGFQFILKEPAYEL